MLTPKRTINTKDFRERLQAGADFGTLMRLYQLTGDELQSLVRRLLDSGDLKQSDLPTGDARFTQQIDMLWKCPACGTNHDAEYDQCPKCLYVPAHLAPGSQRSGSGSGHDSGPSPGKPSQEEVRRIHEEEIKKYERAKQGQAMREALLKRRQAEERARQEARSRLQLADSTLHVWLVGIGAAMVLIGGVLYAGWPYLMPLWADELEMSRTLRVFGYTCSTFSIWCEICTQWAPLLATAGLMTTSGGVWQWWRKRRALRQLRAWRTSTDKSES